MHVHTCISRVRHIGVYEIHIEIKDRKHVLDKENLMTNCISITFHTRIWKIQQQYTRGIWKDRSMVFYLNNRFINPIMFGTILSIIFSLWRSTNFMWML